MLKTTLSTCALSLTAIHSLYAADPKAKATEAPVPAAFTTNCVVCHATDQALVGPSLVEIAKLYPAKNKRQFINWCLEPGRKRPDMPVMPSMAHIPKKELEEIHKYITSITKGKDERVRNNKDLFKQSPSATLRPRIVRTFLPDTGPASMLIALPTSLDHNLIWDTDKCQLRYISIGKIDNFPYLRSNGNSLAKVGKVIYTESPLFKPDTKPQFNGYELTKEGFPTLLYTFGNSTFSEKITTDANTITRVITSSSSIPQILKLESNKKLEVTTKTTGNTLTITYKSL
ncbi:MAG: c-type cytochrome [Akkermansiaceae bacterium]